MYHQSMYNQRMYIQSMYEHLQKHDWSLSWHHVSSKVADHCFSCCWCMYDQSTEAPAMTFSALDYSVSLLQERLAGLEKSSEELSQQHRKELSRLEAALAGAEAAKQKLSEQQAQHSTAGETDLQAAQAAQAEAAARASSLERQIDTLRAQAAASRSGLQEEANSLKASADQLPPVQRYHPLAWPHIALSLPAKCICASGCQSLCNRAV